MRGSSGVIPPSASKSQRSHIMPAVPRRACSPSSTSPFGKRCSIEARGALCSTSPHAASRSDREASGPCGRSAFIGEENFGESTPPPRFAESSASLCLILREAPAVGTQTCVSLRSCGHPSIPSNSTAATCSAREPGWSRKMTRGLAMNRVRLSSKDWQGNLDRKCHVPQIGL